MMTRIGSGLGRLLAWVPVLIAATAAQGAATVPYTVTDLGAASLDQVRRGQMVDYGGGAYTPTLDAGGRSVLITADGTTAYAFPRSSPVTATTDFGSIDPPLGAPISNQETYGNSSNAYSRLQYGLMNAAGLVVGQDESGVLGHDSTRAIEAFAAQRQVDGSFAPTQTLWTPPGATEQSLPVDLNARGQVLGLWRNAQLGFAWSRIFPVFDTSTGREVDIPTELAGFKLDAPLAIDDQGRLLFSGRPATDAAGTPHALLLTPDGVASDPIATPEPATWVILVAAGLIGVVRRPLRGCR